MFFSVLEQFEITKFTFSALFFAFFFSKEKQINIISFLSKVFLFFNRKIFLIEVKYRSLRRFLFKTFSILTSFFIPNSYSTKNYMYSRLMSFCLKNFFKLFFRQKLVLFFRYSVQIIKVKIQYKLQQAIETNFGHGYPYYSRLLNYYPFLFVTFSMILSHNFNGLYFYGFTNTAFLLQNFVISFQVVVGLTLIVYL